MIGDVDSLGAWLDKALVDVPGELAVRVRTALVPEWRDTYLGRAPQVLGDAAVAELTVLLEKGCETRRSAPALLTVDALVTYACELIALSGGDIDAGTMSLLNAICSTLPDNGEAGE